VVAKSAQTALDKKQVKGNTSQRLEVVLFQYRLLISVSLKCKDIIDCCDALTI
jgi:hypothetical protein